MTKLRTVHRCQECGAGSPRWSGRCATCGAWNCLVEELESPTGDHAGPVTAADDRWSLVGPCAQAVPLAEVVSEGSAPRPTGIGELDRVLGGGLVAGSVTLVGGEPGTGKSTLLLQALASLAATSPCLLVTAEESAEQVRLRAERLGVADCGALWLASENELSRLVGHVEAVAPGYLVVDSIQTVFDATLDSPPGAVTQVRHCAQRLTQLAKRRMMATFLVGHVTKDGGLAGPRVLEHLVDTVLAFEGDRHHCLRLLRAAKHRFGPTGELGLFEMASSGLAGVPDAGGRFLGDRRAEMAGSAVAPALDGRRPLLVELQALVVPSNLAVCRRSAEGVDPGRLNLLVAVLERRAGLSLGKADVYALASGGARVTEPGADLALALAVASAWAGVALPDDLVACGEVGLGGELRQVGQLDRRLAEARRLGFRRALLPASASAPPPGMTALPAATIGEALTTLGITGKSRPGAVADTN